MSRVVMVRRGKYWSAGFSIAVSRTNQNLAELELEMIKGRCEMNFIASLRLALVALVLFPFLSTSAGAFIRKLTWDDVLVDQSDLIVIAHLKENRFEGAKDTENPQPARTMFFTTLVVTKVLKGSVPMGDLRVILHDPNYPTVLGKDSPLAIVPSPAGEHPDPTAAIGIAAIMGTIFAISTDDVRQDHLWFFSTRLPSQYRYSYRTYSNAVEPPGLWFPEGIQPVKLEAYYQAIMDGDADAVGAFADGDPNSGWSRRVHFAEAGVEVKDAMAIPDPGQRCDLLVTLYIKDGPFSPAGELAMDGIMACGPLGPAKLIPVFRDPANHTLDRRSILNAWEGKTSRGLDRGAPFSGAAPVIIAWMQNENLWWSMKPTSDETLGAHPGQKGGIEYNDPRAVSFCNIYCSIEALQNLHAQEARQVIQEVRTRWQMVTFDSNNNLLKVCDDALAALQ